MIGRIIPIAINDVYATYLVSPAPLRLPEKINCEICAGDANAVISNSFDPKFIISDSLVNKLTSIPPPVEKSKNKARDIKKPTLWVAFP